MITYIGKTRPYKTFLGVFMFDSEISSDIELNDEKLENSLVSAFPAKYQKKIVGEVKANEPVKEVKQEPEKQEKTLVEQVKEIANSMTFDELMELIQTDTFKELNIKIPKTIKTKEALLNSIIKQIS